VMTTPVEVSTEQIAAYSAIFQGNARPVQPWNPRAWIVASASPAPAALPATGAASKFAPVFLVVLGVVLALGTISGCAAYCRRPPVL
jgi:hypothetical protein